MTTDEAATLLATYELTGSVRETARQLGVNASTVSRRLKQANATIPQPKQQEARDTRFWASAWGQREERTLELIAEKAPTAGFRDLSIFAAIASDKRYREEHPESVRGAVVNIDNRSVHIDTTEAIAALRAARSEMVTDGHQD